MQTITIAHSPDSDDAFMFYALAREKVPTGPYQFRHVLSDIETLNQKAVLGEYEVTAVSFHAYAYLTDQYVLLPHGASIGDGYGPIVVASRPMTPQELQSKKIAVPGAWTTALLALQLFDPSLETVTIPFDRILECVKTGEADAGLIIHEGQLTYAAEGFHKVIDLGEWWKHETGLPLPLGGNVIRRDLGAATVAEVSRLLHASIQYALDHRPEALDYALEFARGMDPKLADRFVGMYVNDLTLDYGERGRHSVQFLLDEAFRSRIIPTAVRARWVAEDAGF
ncbi:MAG: MqnA/MqnD/SBP family protein [Acidobacteriota bacterium]